MARTARPYDRQHRQHLTPAIDRLVETNQEILAFMQSNSESTLSLMQMMNDNLGLITQAITWYALVLFYFYSLINTVHALIDIALVH